MPKTSEPFRSVILAGGSGMRLHPFTASLPKALLPIGERTIIELIILRLVSAGTCRITVAVNHFADLIERSLADGARFGVPIDYVRDGTALGTAGPVGSIDPWTGPLLVTNGDILSDVDIPEILAMHGKRAAAITVGTTLYSWRIESGVVTIDSSQRVRSIVEKPVVEDRISIGTYVLDAAVRNYIVPHERLEMPDLILKLINAELTVVAYDHKGLWLDVGRPEDLAKAQSEAARWADLSGVGEFARTDDEKQKIKK